MKLNKIAFLSFALLVGAQAFAAGGYAPRPAASPLIMKPGPNWYFFENKKATIQLPGEGKIIFGSNGVDGKPLPSYPQWKSTHRNQLILFPGYQEPIMASSEGDVPAVKNLSVFEARFAFVVNQPIQKFNRQRFLSTEFLHEMDPDLNYRVIAKNQTTPSGDAVTDSQPWCEDKNKLCIQAEFEMSTLVKKAVINGYAMLGKKRNPPTGIMLEGELAWNEDADSELLKMMNSEARSLTQKVFYIDHFFQYAVTNLVFQKVDDNRTLVVGMVTVGIQTDVLNMGSKVFEFLSNSSGGLVTIDAQTFIVNGTGLPGLSAVENGLIPYTLEKAQNLREILKNM